MERQAVNSKLLKSVGHDGDQTLEVEFGNNAVYRYTGVTPEHFATMLAADSVGSHFLKTIRNACPCERVDDQQPTA